MKKFFPISFFTFFLFLRIIYPQEKIVEKTDVQGLYKLSDVVISATKNQTSTLELANSVTVIDSAHIVNSNSSGVFELLKNEYGVSFTRQGGPGTLSNINIRGGNSDHTLVLVDGIEINLNNDPSNVYDFAFLSTDNIQSIEILRGPQSTIYGSNSLAGVVNIITRKGNGKPSFSLLADGGSYKTYKTSLGMNGAVADFTYFVTLGRSESEGFSVASKKYGNTEKDGYKIDNISSRFGCNFSGNAELNLFMNYNKSKSDYDQFGGKFGDDPTYVFIQEEFSLRAEGKFQLLDGFWKQKFGFTTLSNIRKYSYDTSAASIYYSKSLYDGAKYKLDWQNDFQINAHNLLTAGIEYNIDETSSEFYAKTFLSPPDYFSNFPKHDAKIAGVFIQDQLKIGESFFSTAGLRFDNHNQFGSSFTYRIAPAYVIWETGTKIKATLGSGFKAPSLFYLYDPAYGNPDLNPEKSIGFDAGVEQYFWKETTLIGITYFQNNYSDLFGFDQNFKTININKAKTSGIESYFSTKIIDDLEIKLNYTFTDAKDISDNSLIKNQKLIRRPENKAGLFASYSFLNRGNVNIEIIFVGQREDLDFSKFPAERIKLDSYVLTNFAAHYDILNFLRLNLGIENIFNIDYEEVLGYATPGLSIYGGVKLSLNDL